MHAKLVKWEYFLNVWHEIPWDLVPDPFLGSTLTVPSLIFFSPVTLICFVIHNQPPAFTLFSPPGLCSPLSQPCPSRLPELTPPPHSHSTCFPTAHTPALHHHFPFVLFLSVYIFVLPARPWVIWGFGPCLIYLWISTNTIPGTVQSKCRMTPSEKKVSLISAFFFTQKATNSVRKLNPSWLTNFMQKSGFVF